VRDALDRNQRPALAVVAAVLYLKIPSAVGANMLLVDKKWAILS